MLSSQDKGIQPIHSRLLRLLSARGGKSGCRTTIIVRHIGRLNLTFSKKVGRVLIVLA